MSDSANTRRRLLQELLETVKKTGAFTEVQAFRLAHESDRREIDALLQRRLIDIGHGRYVLTLEGVRASAHQEARAEIAKAARLLPILREAYRKRPGMPWTSSELAELAGKEEREVRLSLLLLSSFPIWTGIGGDPNTGLVNQISLAENVLDQPDVEVTGAPWDEDALDPSAAVTLKRLSISGYRIFDNFEAELGDLTVIIGANGTGKSSFFDFLEFIRRAIVDPLPPEIDERSVGKHLFHADGPERLAFSISLEIGRERPVSYTCEILGPVGNPLVSREDLSTWNDGIFSIVRGRRPLRARARARARARKPLHFVHVHVHVHRFAEHVHEGSPRMNEKIRMMHQL